MRGARRRAQAALGVLASLAAAAVAAGQELQAPPDAVVERWEQSWRLDAGGGSTYHELRHVRIHNDRAYGAFADPRITFDSETQSAELLSARTRLADGRVVEVPDYSKNEVSPGFSAGWPAYASLRQLVVSMSAVEPGALLELEYRVTTRPRAGRTLSGDLRLDGRYPIESRIVRVELPDDAPLSAWIGGLPEAAVRHALDHDPASRTSRHTWTFARLAGRRDDPQAPPWQERCPRLTFTTAPSAAAWLGDRIARIENAADSSPLITKLAEDWTRDRYEPTEKLRAIQEKLAATFNFVHFDADHRPATLRRASEVMTSNYGLPEESACVLVALVRAAGVAVQPAILTDEAVWREDTPQDGYASEYVVTLGEGGARETWSPQHGRILRTARWAGHTLLAAEREGLARGAMGAWTSADASRVHLRGSISIAENGTYAGTWTLRTSGLFVSPESLRTKDGQTARARALIHRVLPGCEVTGVTVTTLTEDAFDATADVKLAKPLEKVAGAFRLTLAQDGPFLGDVPLPLGTARRNDPVRLTGAFDERIELVIEWPAGWNVEAAPRARLGAARPPEWSVEQTATSSEARLTLARRTRIAERDVSPADYAGLRDAVNALRSEAARTLLLKP